MQRIKNPLYLLALSGLLVLIYFYSSLSTVQVQKSPADKRDYKAVILSNQLQVLLISDPTTEQAAASLDIAVGQFSDPATKLGLAHYLEHMLFLGTKKFPKADEYGDFLSRHGGSSNAYTATENTNYHFNIQPEYLSGALDRFSQFFISPLFNPDYANREIQAVHSEHQKNLINDMRRLYQIQKEVSNSAHPFSQFGTGSLETLGESTGDVNALNKKLVDFYQKNYSSNLMRLVILGKNPIDELEGFAHKYFSPIKNKNLIIADLSAIPVITEQMPREVQIKPIKNIRYLMFNFITPSFWNQWDKRPADILGQLLGHEGQGSLLSYLKSKGWALNLSAGGQGDHRGFGTFGVTVELTPEGLNHKQEITAALFSYLELAKEKTDLSLYFEEVAKVAAIEFQYQEKGQASGYVTQLASLMQRVPAELAPALQVQFKKYPKAELKTLLAAINPTNMTRTLVSKSAITDKIEPYYKGEYSSKPLDNKELASLSTALKIAALRLPEANPFIVSSVALESLEKPDKWPKLIESQTGSQLWFKGGNPFKSPKAELVINISSPQAYITPKEAALTNIWTKLVSNELNEFAYPAKIAGLSFNIHNQVTGVQINLKGYPEQFVPILKAILNRVKDTSNFSPEQFSIYRQEMKEERLNRRQSRAYQRAIYEFSYITSELLWHNEDYLKVADSLTYTDFKAHTEKLLKRLYIQTLMEGNLTQKAALALQAQITSGIGHQPLPKGEATIQKTYLLNSGERLLNSFAIEDTNSAYYLYLQAGPVAPRQTALLQLLNTVVTKPYYAQMRTNEQLGYLVWTGATGSHQVDGLSFLIQSAEKGPEYLNKRTWAFLQKFRSQIQGMTEDDFLGYKKTLVQAAIEKPKNLGEEVQLHWSRIRNGSFDFDYREVYAKEFEKITQKDLLDFFDQLVLSPQRKEFITFAWGKNHPKKGKNLDPAAFKAAHKTYNPKEMGNKK
ncbi:MAG: insulinase family protein [SAR324 cluster bacterium]|nr:insulinase family protein [SAR324 cluster bacterium]